MPARQSCAPRLSERAPRVPSTWRWRCWRRGARAAATGSACASPRPAPWTYGHAGAAFARGGGGRCEVRRRAATGQSIAGNSARPASCAAQRQFGRGRAGERRAHRRLAGQAKIFFDASPGDPSLIFTFTTVDEFCCARQDVIAAASALRHLTLETQSRGKLHTHGIF